MTRLFKITFLFLPFWISNLGCSPFASLCCWALFLEGGPFVSISKIFWCCRGLVLSSKILSLFQTGVRRMMLSYSFFFFFCFSNTYFGASVMTFGSVLSWFLFPELEVSLSRILLFRSLLNCGFLVDNFVCLSFLFFVFKFFFCGRFDWSSRVLCEMDSGTFGANKVSEEIRWSLCWAWLLMGSRSRTVNVNTKDTDKVLNGMPSYAPPLPSSSNSM